MPTPFPNLVLLPGLDGTGELFAGLTTALPSEIDVQVIRFPAGERLTYIELLDYVRAACPENEPFVVLAESFSTPLAMRLAALDPPCLKGVILCAGFARNPVGSGRARVFSFLAPLIFRFRVPRFALRRWLVGSKAPIELVNTVQRTVGSLCPAAAVARLRAVFSCDVRSELSEIRVPIHYICATQDRLVPVSSFEEIRRVRADVTVSNVVGSHFILQTEPLRCAEIVTAFMKRSIRQVDSEGVTAPARQPLPRPRPTGS